MPMDNETVVLRDQDGHMLYRSPQLSGVAQEFEYDDTGRVIYSRVVSPEEDTDFTFDYSEDGMRLDVTRHASEGDTLFMEVEYDGKGHMIWEADHSIAYDCISTWEYNDDGKVIYQSQDFADTFYEYKNEYDSNGRLMIRRMNHSNGTSSISEYTRDERGRILSIDRNKINSEGVTEEWSHTLNEYNSYDDLSKKCYYNTYEEDDTDWDRITYYIYDYDHIDPNIGDDYHF